MSAELGQCHETLNGGMDCAANHRSLPVECGSTLSGPRLLRSRAGYGPWAFEQQRIARVCHWQNGYAERLIGTIRRECVDHLIVFGEAHLRRMLREYEAYYNGSRTHRALNHDAPVHRPVRASAPSHHDLCSAAFITNIAGFEFSVQTGVQRD